MTNAKSTKKALLMSVLSLVLCFSMLLGTTFAWFTDSVTSANNIIKSGNLDIELEYWTGTEWKTVEGASDILTNTLWEPGVTEVAYLRVANAGSLALKYQLGINIVSEIAGVNAAGETFKLSDYIQFGVVENVNGKTGAYATREDAVKAVSAAKKISAGYTKAASMTAGQELYFALVVYMPTEVGNVANHNGINIPEINLGINVIATQVAAEEDSFDKYYDGATPWYGAIDTTWYNNTDTVFEIGTAEELAGLAQLVNDGTDSFAGKTIKLVSNIDLNNLNWTAIGNWANAFEGTFDGNGYTIGNLYINAPEGEGVGLFGVVANATLKNIALDNVAINAYSMVAAVVGAAYPATVSNCRVTGDVEIVSEWAYVAGIAGYCYYGTQVDGCSVIADEGSLIQSETRNAVGGITAWLLEGDHKVTNCQVENLNLVGWTNVGAITGFVHYSNTIEGCSVKNVTLTKTRVDGNPAIGLIAGGYSYSANNAITLRNNAVNGATLNGTHVAYSAYNELYGSEYGGATTANFVLENNVTENITNNLMLMKKATPSDLASALANDTVVYLAAGEYTLPSLADYTNLIIVGTDGVSVAPVNSFNFGANTTIKNVTITSTSGSAVRYGYINGDVTFENCDFIAKQWAFHVDDAKGNHITFNNCTFKNRVALAASGTYEFNSCVFQYQYSNYNTINVYSEASFNNCKWDSKREITLGENAKVVIDGDVITQDIYFISDMSALENFQRKVNSNDASFVNLYVMLSADLDMNDGYYATWTPIGQTGGGYFKGTFDGHGYTISNMKVDSTNKTGANYATGFFGWLNGATVKNLNFDNATVIGNHYVGVVAGYMEASGCTISNCNVTNSTVTATHVTDDVCGDKIGVIVGYANNAGVIVENCSAADCTVVAGRDAGQIVGAAKTANVVNCTATNVTVTADGTCTGANIREEIIGRVMG